jgi:hypothetical protein
MLLARSEQQVRSLLVITILNYHHYTEIPAAGWKPHGRPEETPASPGSAIGGGTVPYRQLEVLGDPPSGPLKYSTKQKQPS